MRVSARRFAEAYLDTVLDVPEAELDAVARKFVLLVVKRRARRLLPKILTEVGRLWNERHGIETVRVTTASTVDRHLVEERLGREVELMTLVDTSILGGAIVEHGDQRLDASVLGRLKRLREALRRKE